MKLCLALLCTASALAAATPSAQTNAPLKIPAAERVPWSNLAELERYAANGHLKACAQLGEQLARGDGVPQDTARALPLLERAARGGIGSAAFRLGMIYDDGQGVPPDRRRALPCEPPPRSRSRDSARRSTPRPRRPGAPRASARPPAAMAPWRRSRLAMMATRRWMLAVMHSQAASFAGPPAPSREEESAAAATVCWMRKRPVTTATR